MVNRLYRDEDYARETELRAVQRNHVRRLKDKLDHEGYKHRISFYGSVIHRETKEIGYRRIEILKHTPFTELDYYRLETGFKYIVPSEIYTLWTMELNGKLKKRYP